MTTFTAYRATKDFVHSLNENKTNLRRHLDKMMSGSNARSAVSQMLKDGQMAPAATVECEIDDLFEQTNTINHNWTENASVTLLEGSENLILSSTSVGDVFSDSEGKFFIVEDFGYGDL